MIVSAIIRTAIALVFMLGAIQSSNARYDDGARYAFSASVLDKAIYIVDLHSHETVDQIPLALQPDSVAASQGIKALVVAHRQEKKLSLIDLSSEDLIQIDYPLTISPDHVTVSPPGETVAIYDENLKIIEVHALKRRAVLVRVENVFTNNDLTFNLDGSKMFWTDHTTGTLNTADLWSDTQQLKLSRDGATLSALSRSTDGQLGFVSDSSRNVVVIIDLKTLKIIKEIGVGNKPQRPWGTADGQYMLIPNGGDNTLTTIATATLEVVYTIQGVQNPVSINPGWLDTKTALIGENGDVTFIETASGRELQKFDIASQAIQGVVTSDSKTLAITSNGGMHFFNMSDSSLIGQIDNLPTDISKAALAISNNLCH